MNSDEARQREHLHFATAPRIDLDEMSLAPLHCSDDMATLSVSELAATDLMSRACMWLRALSYPPLPPLSSISRVCVTNQHHKAGVIMRWLQAYNI